MKKVYGHIYGNTKEELIELIECVTEKGFEVAYESESSVIAIKEVADESGNQET